MKLYPRLLLAAAISGALALSSLRATHSSGHGSNNNNTNLPPAVAITATPSGNLGVVQSAQITVTITITNPTTGAPLSGINANTLKLEGAKTIVVDSGQLGVSTNSAGQIVKTYTVSGLIAGCYKLTVQTNASSDWGPGSGESAPGLLCVEAPVTQPVADTTPPTITVEAQSVTVECDGSGNAAALQAWLGNQGGAQATDDSGSVFWSYPANASLSDGCGATGSVTVTFTAKDAAGNSATTTATFTVIDTTPPVAPSSDVRNFLPKEAPITFTLTAGSDGCGSATAQITSVTAHAVNGSGKTIAKAIAYTISGASITITDSGGVGTIITITGTSTDECGNVSAAANFVANVLRPANEGVGNGVDGNTPGHTKNGGNDDPGTAPGSPGARTKNGRG